MTRATGADRPVRAEVRGSTSVQAGTALLVTLDGTDHILNGTALALWQLCDGQTTVDEMVAAVSELFGLPLQRSEQDVTAAVTALATVGLVSWS